MFKRSNVEATTSGAKLDDFDCGTQSKQANSNVMLELRSAIIAMVALCSGTEDRGFESRQGVRFLGLKTLQCSSPM
jgi:hypothetical protein